VQQHKCFLFCNQETDKEEELLKKFIFKTLRKLRVLAKHFHYSGFCWFLLGFTPAFIFIFIIVLADARQRIIYYYRATQSCNSVGVTQARLSWLRKR